MYLPQTNQPAAKDVVIQHVDPNPGLSFRANLYARMIEDDTMRGWNISFAAENSTIVPSNVSTVEGDPSVSTTHLMAWADPPAQDIENALLFYQTRGDDITMYTGSLSSGKWSSTVLPIPDEWLPNLILSEHDSDVESALSIIHGNAIGAIMCDRLI